MSPENNLKSPKHTLYRVCRVYNVFWVKNSEDDFETLQVGRGLYHSIVCSDLLWPLLNMKRSIYLFMVYLLRGSNKRSQLPKRFSPPPHSWAILRTLVSLAHSTAFLWKTGLVWPPKPACFLSSAGTSWQKTCGIVDMVWLYPNQWPSDRCQQFKRSSQLQPHMIKPFASWEHPKQASIGLYHR